MNLSLEFRQIYNFVQLETRDEMITFCSQKVSVTARPHNVQISTFGGIFSPICGMHGRILMKLIKSTHYSLTAAST